MNLNQEQLIIFKTVMERGSFSAAARALGKVPSAVSMSIANLELDLNLQLFERLGREPRPTEHAYFLLEKTKHLLTAMQQWQQQAHNLSLGLETCLTIVIVSELMHLDWTEDIARMADKFPQLHIQILSAPQEDANRMLQQGQAQLALMFERECLNNNEQFIELKSVHLVAVAAQQSALAQLKHVQLEQLQAHRQIVVASRDRELDPELLFSQQYWRTDNHYSACQLILKQLGWGILPLDMLHENPLLQKQLKVLPLSDFTPKFHYFVDLVWNTEQPLGLATQFLIDYLRGERKKYML